MEVVELGVSARQVSLPNGVVFRASRLHGGLWLTCCLMDTDGSQRGWSLGTDNWLWNDRLLPRSLKAQLKFIRERLCGSTTTAGEVLMALHEPGARGLIDEWLTRHAIEVMCGEAQDQ